MHDRRGGRPWSARSDRASVRLVHLRFALLAAVGLVACGPPASSMSVGPAGGLVSSEDDGLTLVLWPGALGEFVELTIAASAGAPESFGPAYEITANPPSAV